MVLYEQSCWRNRSYISFTGTNDTLYKQLIAFPRRTTLEEGEHYMCYMNRLEFACLAYFHSGKCTYHMCTNEERLSMSREIYLRSTLVTREEEGEHVCAI